jgi:hypothetical protein
MYCRRLVTLEWNQMYHLPVDGSFMSKVFVEKIYLKDE